MDRAALDAALELGLSVGGWCPKGRLAEDGTIDPRYPLVETPSADLAQRTEYNVRDSDGTLILHRGKLTGGTALTAALAALLQKPLLLIDLSNSPGPEDVRRFTEENRIETLNIAGPRESGEPGIYGEAKEFLRLVLFFLKPHVLNALLLMCKAQQPRIPRLRNNNEPPHHPCVFLRLK